MLREYWPDPTTIYLPGNSTTQVVEVTKFSSIHNLFQILSFYHLQVAILPNRNISSPPQQQLQQQLLLVVLVLLLLLLPLPLPPLLPPPNYLCGGHGEHPPITFSKIRGVPWASNGPNSRPWHQQGFVYTLGGFGKDFCFGFIIQNSKGTIFFNGWFDIENPG